MDNVRLLLETAYDRGAKSREKDIVFVQEQDEARQQDKEKLYAHVVVFKGKEYISLEEVMLLIRELKRTWRKLNETDNSMPK